MTWELGMAMLPNDRDPQQWACVNCGLPTDIGIRRCVPCETERQQRYEAEYAEFMRQRAMQCRGAA